MSGAEELVQAIESARQELSAADIDDDGDPIIRPAVGDDRLPSVSVEVLAYNQGKYLGECIKSIACQKTSFPFEIIIGNDCSTDDTQEVAEQLQRAYPDLITIVTTRHNVGLNRNARNVRRLMRGRYAAFCEGDDWWLTDSRLQAQVDYMENHPEVSLLHGCSAFYDERTGKYCEKKLRFNLPANRFGHVFDETYRIETATVMCRTTDLRRIYRECPQLVGARYLMLDTQLFCLLASYGKTHCFDYALSVRRLTGASLSGNANVVKSMRYNDNAFSMKMALCDYFKVGWLTRLRSENFYLHQTLNILETSLNHSESNAVARRLYPDFLWRLWVMRFLKMPKSAFLRKIYCRIVFPSVRYRISFYRCP